MGSSSLDSRVGTTMVRLAVLFLFVAATANAASPRSMIEVRKIQPSTTDELTRLVIELSGPTAYRLTPIHGQPRLGVPDRLQVELRDTQIDPRLARLSLPQGPVVRVRGTQVDGGVTRLLLDVPGFSAFGGFWMNDPPRLIVDVRGPARDTKQRTVSPTNVPVPPPSTPVPGKKVVEAVPRRTTAVPTATPIPSPTAAPTAKRRFKIVIDPGHGGKDSGAVGVEGVVEKDVVLAIALLLKSRLASSETIDVVLTRQTDVFLRLEERTARANQENADLFVSIHANASTNPDAYGVETYYLNNTNDRATLRLAAMENGLRGAVGQNTDDHAASLILSDLIQNFKVQESVTLANDVQRALVAELVGRGTPSNDLGTKKGPFYVLVGAGMPCVLAEVSFVTHPREGARLASRSYQETIADGLLRGIRRFVENARTTGNL